MRIQVRKGSAELIVGWIAWLCIPWFMPAELFPQRQRSMGCALATLANFVFNALVGALVPTLLTALGGWLFIGFCGLNLLFAAIVYVFYPETSGLSLEVFSLLYWSQDSFFSSLWCHK